MAGGVIGAVFRREFKIAVSRWSDLATPLVFFAIVCSLFPLAVTPTPDLLREIGPGVLWVAALLANLVSLPALFRADFEDGTLERLALSPHSLSLIVLVKVTAHWLTTAVPLVLLSPLLGMTYGLDGAAINVLVVSLLAGTPALALIGAAGAALTAGLKQGGGLLGLLTLPLAMPVLIFGARATGLAVLGESPAAPLYFLAALSVLAVTLLPLACAAALRICLD